MEVVGVAVADVVAEGVADGVEVGGSSNADNTAMPESSPMKLLLDLAKLDSERVVPFANVNVVLADTNPKICAELRYPLPFSANWDGREKNRLL
jgi:hypothetical protein